MRAWAASIGADDVTTTEALAHDAFKEIIADAVGVPSHKLTNEGPSNT
jgi:hypothetical protein